MVIDSYPNFSDSLLFWWSKLSRFCSIYFENIIYSENNWRNNTSLRKRNNLSTIEYILWFHRICYITIIHLFSKRCGWNNLCWSSSNWREQYLIQTLYRLFVTKRYSYISPSPMFRWNGHCKFSYIYINSLLYAIIISCCLINLL